MILFVHKHIGRFRYANFKTIRIGPSKFRATVSIAI